MSTRMAKAKPRMRKLPAQARSRATVDAIVEAAARILSDQGWAGFTTNKVAEAAGVSIGSYYQYFPDKHSLIEAIRDRHLDDCLAGLARATAGKKPLATFVGELIDTIVAMHSIHPGLHRVLLDEAPSPEGFRDPESAFEKAYLGYFRRAVSTYAARAGRMPEEASAMILSDAIDGVIHNAARRGTLQNPDVRNELVRMIEAYMEDLP